MISTDPIAPDIPKSGHAEKFGYGNSPCAPMVHNLYLILVVVCRALGLFWIGGAVLGLVLSVVVGGSGFIAAVVGLASTVIGGILLWFFAKPIAVLITKDLG